MIRINAQRAIGDVLFIVEGAKDDVHYLRAMFTRLFRYKRNDNYFETKNGNLPTYTHPSEKASTVTVMNAPESCISSIYDLKAMGKLFRSLEKINFNVKNARIYFLFDRDPKSNTNTEQIRNSFCKYQSADDNGVDPQGLFLLSYPSVEAHLISHVKSLENETCGLGEDLKDYVKSLSPRKDLLLVDRGQGFVREITEKSLIHATEEFLAFFERELGYSFEIDAANHGLAVYEHQEHYYAQEEQYKLFSQLVHALIDLGIIELEDIY